MEKLIIAHRGGTASATENTIESFEDAIRNGADMIEFDVRRTKDGVFIVHHNGIICRKRIRKIDWAEIEKINRKRCAAVPKLEEVLKMAKGKIKVDIEIKEGGHETAIMEIVLRYLEYKDFIITSSNYFSIEKVKEKYPRVRTGLLFSFRKSKRRLSRLLLTRKYGSNSADYFLPHSFLVRLGFLERAKRFKKPCIPWGVNSPRLMKKVLENNRVEGIITDKLNAALAVKQALMRK